MSHRIFITGAAGYVGAMLVDQFSRRPDVEAILGLDKEPIPDLIKSNSKLAYIEANTADGSWQERARNFKPDIVIHTAWQIREVYGHKEITWRWNVDGSDNIFKFAFGNPEVKKLIHFSTVASYGAFKDNSVEHFFTEEEPFRKTDYLYAEEKRIAEEHLKSLYEKSDKKVMVSVIRPAAITGPRGRYMRIRFGLQAALSGSLKHENSKLYNLISAMVSWVPITPKWLRQYVHEDDVNDIVEKLAFENYNFDYEAFNLAPPGAVVRGSDMARAVNKRMLPIYPWMVRLAFFWFWHLTRGKVPTSRGSWKGYSYPIAVDGSKVTRVLGYQYKYPSLEAFQETHGRYEKYIKSV